MPFMGICHAGGYPKLRLRFPKSAAEPNTQERPGKLGTGELLG